MCINPLCYAQILCSLEQRTKKCNQRRYTCAKKKNVNESFIYLFYFFLHYVGGGRVRYVISKQLIHLNIEKYLKTFIATLKHALLIFFFNLTPNPLQCRVDIQHMFFTDLNNIILCEFVYLINHGNRWRNYKGSQVEGLPAEKDFWGCTQNDDLFLDASTNFIRGTRGGGHECHMGGGARATRSYVTGVHVYMRVSRLPIMQTARQDTAISQMWTYKIRFFSGAKNMFHVAK